jgi:hypothetical protein
MNGCSATKYSHEMLVKVTKTVSGWRKDLQVKQVKAIVLFPPTYSV